MGRSNSSTKLNADHAPFLQDAHAQTVCAILQEAGHQIYFVGGCVRNALIKTAQSDVDLATDAVPQTVIELGEKAGLRAVPTGIEHGTVTLVSEGHPFEITTFRRDVETDGRRAVVAFSDNIEDDARRRDFTMNAIYSDPMGNIVDPVGGVPDALAGRVVFIDDATARIREDYLRVLRFFRFWSFYADQREGFDADSLAAIAETLDGLDSLSAERVGHELLKLLSAPDPSIAISTMDKVGVLARLLPVQSTEVLVRLVHLEESTSTDPDPIRRLASLGPTDAPNRLRLSKRDSRDLEELTRHIGQNLGPKAIGAILGTSRGWDVQLLKAATLGNDLIHSKEDVQQGATAKFPIEASDLMPAFSGPKLGAELARLRELWLKSELSLDKSALLG